MTVLELVAALVAILASAIIFTNSVEILGDRLNLGQGAVGSVLAAVGTALPETMIPVVAIVGALLLGRDPAVAGEIGIGAILGAPFLLATLAMFVVAASAFGYRRRRRGGVRINVDQVVLSRDLTFFLVFYAIAAAAGIIALPFAVKIGIAVVLVGAYVVHVILTLRHGGDSLEEVPGNLYIWRFSSPAPAWAAATQLIIALAVMVGGARLFVDAVEQGSNALGIPAGLIALVLAPLATELPEKFNSVIWMRSDKDTLAMGNISGAMVFQSTIPVSLGILFTQWQLNALDILSVGLALLSGVALVVLLRTKKTLEATYLLGGGALYVVFLAAALFLILG